MLECQKKLFQLEKDITYLNCAYMSPQLKAVEQAGINNLIKKNNPHHIKVDHFFKPVEELKQKFADLIQATDKDRIALIPAASYGMAVVANNLDLNKGDNIVLLEEQFPSNYYSWDRLSQETGAEIRIVKAPNGIHKGQTWNQAVLNAIDENTRLVSIAHVHWATGTVYDLKKIRAISKANGALLVVDGTQSVGAFSMDVEAFGLDALVCGGYKWLMGPYSLGLAYFGPTFDNGKPIEENWINRFHSEDFKSLVNYQPLYRPKAGRYSVGEHSNFILVPMLNEAIKQLLQWGTDNIQSYCKILWQSVINDFVDLGCNIEHEDYRAYHLLGIGLDESFDTEKLKAAFDKNKIFVSFRGDSIRVSTHVYNEVEDLQKLLQCFKLAKRVKTIV